MRSTEYQSNLHYSLLVNQCVFRLVINVTVKLHIPSEFGTVQKGFLVLSRQGWVMDGHEPDRAQEKELGPCSALTPQNPNREKGGSALLFRISFRVEERDDDDDDDDITIQKF